MRAKDGEIWRDERHVKVMFEGRSIFARKGETVAAALAANGLNVFRHTPEGAPRGQFCGMGVCQDCLVEIDGRPNRRACMTKIDGPVTVRRPDPDMPPKLAGGGPGDAGTGRGSAITPDVLVVGGGAGGLTAAACAAEAGARVVLVDERPVPGGQYFKQPLAIPDLPRHILNDRQFLGGHALIERARHAGVQFLKGEVWAAFDPLEIHIHGARGSRIARPGQLIVATGAYERGLPVPGWTLPGVMTTGAAQTLLRSYRVLAGQRVLVAGNGPLNLQVAAELVEAGAAVMGVAELAARPSVRSPVALWRMAANAPDLALRGFGYLRRLKRARVPVYYGHVLARVDEANGALRAAIRSRNGDEVGLAPSFEVDTVLMGYGFLPSNEILRLMGCAHEYDAARGSLVTVRDTSCRTTVEGVYGVGDCCGLGGARAAEAEGVLAGLSAAEEAGQLLSPALVRQRRKAQGSLQRQRRFQSGLWSVFDADRPGLALATARTVVCRCEEVTLGQIDALIDGGTQSMAEIKRCTRLGMGRCQGRYCVPLLAELLHARFGHGLDEYALFAPRPPVKPVPLGLVADGDDA
ncbi:MAG: FAD-dependent oxidoreductase [Hyphomicrobiales bacterium]